MRADLLLFAAELTRQGEPFVMATVVRREAPSSARVGDTALITAGGAFHGWLGGSCTQPTVVREALRALEDGVPRLVALSGNPDLDRREGVTALPMTCHSGGSVDVYIEPVLPAPRLVVFGLSPVAQSLARLAKAMGFTVDAVDPDADRAAFPDADRVLTQIDSARAPALSGHPAEVVAVVATMGGSDDEATLAALALEPWYLGVVASRRRFAEIKGSLETVAAPEAVGRIHNPAGLDIGAHAPAEIALSIMAEVVKLRRAGEVVAAQPALEELDPVCGMKVRVAGAKWTHQHQGRVTYFCGRGCRDRFAQDPELFLHSSGPGAAG